MNLQLILSLVIRHGGLSIISLRILRLINKSMMQLIDQKKCNIKFTYLGHFRTGDYNESDEIMKSFATKISALSFHKNDSIEKISLCTSLKSLFLNSWDEKCPIENVIIPSSLQNLFVISHNLNSQQFINIFKQVGDSLLSFTGYITGEDSFQYLSSSLTNLFVLVKLNDENLQSLRSTKLLSLNCRLEASSFQYIPRTVVNLKIMCTQLDNNSFSSLPSNLTCLHLSLETELPSNDFSKLPTSLKVLKIEDRLNCPKINNCNFPDQLTSLTFTLWPGLSYGSFNLPFNLKELNMGCANNVRFEEEHLEALPISLESLIIHNSAVTNFERLSRLKNLELEGKPTNYLRPINPFPNSLLSLIISVHFGKCNPIELSQLPSNLRMLENGGSMKNFDSTKLPLNMNMLHLDFRSCMNTLNFDKCIASLKHLYLKIEQAATDPFISLQHLDLCTLHLTFSHISAVNNKHFIKSIFNIRFSDSITLKLPNGQHISLLVLPLMKPKIFGARVIIQDSCSAHLFREYVPHGVSFQWNYSIVTFDLFKTPPEPITQEEKYYHRFETLDQTKKKCIVS